METAAQTEPAILVVEDDAVLRRVMAELLALYGYRVDVASDAYRAEALLDRRHYDAVVTDIHLPGHGLSTLEHTRRRRPGTPVILVTSLRSPALRRRAIASGAFAVLEKPLTGPELRSVIDRALRFGGGASGSAGGRASGDGERRRSSKRTTPGTLGGNAA